MADSLHLNLLKQGSLVWNKWRHERPEIQPDLSKARLREMILVEYDLSGTNLSGADLRKAILIEASLYHANLSNTDLRGANLKNVDLSESNLGGANFCDANLEGANLEGAIFEGAIFEGAYVILSELEVMGLNKAKFNSLRDSKMWKVGITRSAIVTCIKHD